MVVLESHAIQGSVVRSSVRITSHSETATENAEDEDIGDIDINLALPRDTHVVYGNGVIIHGR